MNIAGSMSMVANSW